MGISGASLGTKARSALSLVAFNRAFSRRTKTLAPLLLSMVPPASNRMAGTHSLSPPEATRFFLFRGGGCRPLGNPRILDFRSDDRGLSQAMPEVSRISIDLLVAGKSGRPRIESLRRGRALSPRHPITSRRSPREQGESYGVGLTREGTVESRTPRDARDLSPE